MTIFAELRVIADDLIGDYGTAMTLEKVTEGAYNVATGVTAESEAAGVAFNGAISTKPPDSADKVTPTFSMEAGDIFVTVSDDALSISFEPRDIVVIDSLEWRVVSVDPPYDDDTVVVRTVQLRREDSV